MTMHSIAISKETYQKIDSGEQQSLVVPMSRTIERTFAVCPPEDFCLIVADSTKHSRMTFSYSGHTTEKRDGKDCLVFPLKELQHDLY